MTQQSDEDKFSYFGDYSPPDAQRLLCALESAQIKFAIDCNDGIHSVAAKGSYGANANIRIYVDPIKVSEAEKLRADLFGDGWL